MSSVRVELACTCAHARICTCSVSMSFRCDNRAAWRQTVTGTTCQQCIHSTRIAAGQKASTILAQELRYLLCADRRTGGDSRAGKGWEVGFRSVA